MKAVVPLPDVTDSSECEESGGLYQTLVCMGEWIIWRDDIGFDGQETGPDFRKGI
jgi:hypothetical protein